MGTVWVTAGLFDSFVEITSLISRGLTACKPSETEAVEESNTALTEPSSDLCASRQELAWDSLRMASSESSTDRDSSCKISFEIPFSQKTFP